MRHPATPPPHDADEYPVGVVEIQGATVAVLLIPVLGAALAARTAERKPPGERGLLAQQPLPAPLPRHTHRLFSRPGRFASSGRSVLKPCRPIVTKTPGAGAIRRAGWQEANLHGTHRKGLGRWRMCSSTPAGRILTLCLGSRPGVRL
jgi:hypothetical protein